MVRQCMDYRSHAAAYAAEQEAMAQSTAVVSRELDAAQRLAAHARALGDEWSPVMTSEPPPALPEPTLPRSCADLIHLRAKPPTCDDATTTDAVAHTLVERTEAIFGAKDAVDMDVRCKAGLAAVAAIDCRPR